MLKLDYVDVVVIFEENTPRKLINEICPNILVKGGDYTKEEIVGADQVLKNGGEVVIIPLVQGYSTTKMINVLNEKGLTGQD